MTRDEFLELVKRYGDECAAGGAGYTVDDAAKIWIDITVAVDAHWIDSDPKRGTCQRPPIGWYCTRNEGHEGPCPTWPVIGRPQTRFGRLMGSDRPPETEAKIPGHIDLAPIPLKRRPPEMLRSKETRGVIGSLRCRAEHNPGTWPYAARCVRDAGHLKPWPKAPEVMSLEGPTPDIEILPQEDHIDSAGLVWR